MELIPTPRCLAENSVLKLPKMKLFDLKLFWKITVLFIGLNFPSNSFSTENKIPKSHGEFSTATTIFQLTDLHRKDDFSDERNQFRKIMIQVWYPAEVTLEGEKALYFPSQNILEVMKKEKYYGLNQILFDEWKTLRTNSVFDLPISKKQTKYPLLLFSHGLGVSRSNYTIFVEELASYGYIVVSIDHPYVGLTVLPTGRTISISHDKRKMSPETNTDRVIENAKDASFVLDKLLSDKSSSVFVRFAKHIDSKRVGMLGHSLGGATAFETCRIDHRFKACANMDGAPFGEVTKIGVKKPSLLLRGNPVYSDEELTKRGETREQREKFLQQMKVLFESFLPRQKGIPAYIVRIKGTGHMSFSDTPFLMPELLTRQGGTFIEPNRGFSISISYLRAFFEKYLKINQKRILDEDNPPFSEVEVEKFF